MGPKLEISFNSPQCGWMSVGFTAGTNEFHTTTANTPHKSALPDLMRILTEISNPESSRDEYVLQWNRDPEEFDFQFVRDGENLLLEIYQYPTDEREAAKRRLVFSHRGTIREVVNAFAETFEHLYEDRETDEFDFNWRQPFPNKEFEEFKKTIWESVAGRNGPR